MLLLGIVVILIICLAAICIGAILKSSSSDQGMCYEKCDKISCSACYDKEQCSTGRKKMDK